MDLMLNELSVEGQFFNPSELREAIRKVVAMRNAANGFGVEVYCHRNVSNIAVASGEALRVKLQQVLPRNEKRAVFNWLDKGGPFSSQHDIGEWYEHDNNIVTDTGLAEATHQIENEFDWRMLSFATLNWERSPLTVTRRKDDNASVTVDIPNYWDMSALKPVLEKAAPPLVSWQRLEEVSRQRFSGLIFTADSFADMSGRPFALGVAERILVRLNVLDRICTSGPDSPEGKKLLADHFGHTTSWFSNTTGPQINMFKKKLTFRVNGVDTLCPWHGKINNPPYRIHFTWPISEGKVHVVYVGWKITVS